MERIVQCQTNASFPQKKYAFPRAASVVGEWGCGCERGGIKVFESLCLFFLTPGATFWQTC